MTYTYTLDGETPSKKNSRINTRSGRSFPSAQYTAWHDAALLQLARQWKPYKPIDSSIVITFTFVHADRKRRDSDNQVSSILDLLQDAGIIAGDHWGIVSTYTVMNMLGDKAECKLMINA